MGSETKPNHQTSELTIKVMPESGFLIQARIQREGDKYPSTVDVAAVSDLKALKAWIEFSHFGGEGSQRFEVRA